eukprot:CAMPEP_0197535324 /NCGR_PEP_ID=MMETSP1318-20131121/50194_1 /TAXON_ID=552666 /ORGANISM="Partenskyella glossopodia, Strain RCC365" /LENGTH=354 /DNA_ID=CAMNT_0043092859 /DNA_START=141 /DNA_END=1205 /DNA_ORIENTATION=-
MLVFSFAGKNGISNFRGDILGVRRVASALPNIISESAQSERMWVRTNTGVRMPRLIYGTAWKKAHTTDLVEEAVTAGFRGIDTACQPRHYREDLVGEAIKRLEQKGVVSRNELFIQTKYTPPGGQDMSSIPYNPRAEIEQQVMESFNTSLKNLCTDYIDSLVMHSPLETHEDTMKAWRVMEKLYSSGRVGQLGMSNIYDLDRLQKLLDDAKVKPAVIQNRFYLDSGYDTRIRAFCLGHGIIYQSFWTLTANPHILKSPVVSNICAERGWTPAQVFFRYLIEKGFAPLTGTTSRHHMKEDLEVITNPDFSLRDEEMKGIESVLDAACAAHGYPTYSEALTEFKPQRPPPAIMDEV